VDVLHAVEDNPPNLLQALVRTHGTYGCPLHKNVTLRQQLDSLDILSTFAYWSFSEVHAYLERTSVWSNDPLSPLHKPFLIRNYVPNLDDVTRNGIVQNFNRLSDVHTSGEQFDQVAGFEDDVWIVCFAGGPH